MPNAVEGESMTQRNTKKATAVAGVKDSAQSVAKTAAKAAAKTAAKAASKTAKAAAKKAGVAIGAPPTAKLSQLSDVEVDVAGTRLTTDQGILVENTDNSLRAGVRGPSLIEDFHLREKIMRFDHERIPERVVHARGSGAHGYFEVFDSMAEYTRASFLANPARRTPVFVRFSTVQGPRGSFDTPRDVRGFATKFYTDEGNFDLVGNNMPVFFIQDGIKFPDLVHALKPEPHNEIPTAGSAHDTFWDFVTLQPETMHHVMWLMSDRALPRSYAMMQGFGVHTFRMVNAAGRSTFVKFHWKPKLGTHSLVWDEAQAVSGKDPDFNRRDLWDSIEAGNFPEYELGVQLIPESDQFAYGIDLLDPTKIIPEEVVPVVPIGRMVLNRNPENFFAETEQVAFCVGNLVPGIDVTDDPLMQARLFSYLDTQLTRLGGPNFARIPINQPVAPVANHQRDGFHQDQIYKGQASYHPNSIGGGCPVVVGAEGFVHFPEEVQGPKIRRRSETMADHYSQVTLFWNSMSDWEKQHIVAAYRFELGKVTRMHIRELMVTHLNQIDHELGVAVAAGIGIEPPKEGNHNHGLSSPALSQANSPRVGVTGRKVAVLVADGVNKASVDSIVDAFHTDGAIAELLAPVDGAVSTDDGGKLAVTRAMTTVGSVLYDAVIVPDGEDCAFQLAGDGFAVHFVAEAYKHAKAVGAVGSGVALLEQAEILVVEGELGEELAEDMDAERVVVDDLAAVDVDEIDLVQDIDTAVDTDALLEVGVVIDSEASVDFLAAMLAAVAAHRHYNRPIDAIAA